MSVPAIPNARRIVFPGKQEVVIEPFDPGIPGPGEVRVRTHLSLMSTGTENIVFNRHFDPGTHWDNWVKYPFHPGYTSVGVVDAVGEGAEPLRVGDRVAFRIGHRSHEVIGADACFPIPESLPFEQALWFSLAKIAFHGARAADYRLGDSAMIIGAGPIGQMSLRWARAAGVESILAVDAASHRMPLARAGGATAAIAAPIEQAREAILQAGGGRLPRVVIDSTGNAAVFSAALGLAADRGTVVILGDTGQPARQALTSDVIMRGLTIIGAHDGHTTQEWSQATITRLFFSLAASGRFPLEGLNSHVFKPEQCAEAYATANRDRAVTMGIVFDWTEDGGVK
ncbi:MAG: zinc-binding dehydrogenase [Terrimicrobiaceae bacterium]|nr:zinc-binding dehydrogenase [Terrimicrobiaceae bacterium]